MEKANAKLKVLARFCSYMRLVKKKFHMNSFFAAQVSYCLLIWLIDSCSNNKKVKWLHERYLWLIYCDKTSLYEEVLEEDGSVSIHKKHLSTCFSGKDKEWHVSYNCFWYFCLGRKSSEPYATKWLSFTLYTNSI